MSCKCRVQALVNLRGTSPVWKETNVTSREDIWYKRARCLNHQARYLYLLVQIICLFAGLHKLCHPTIRDGSTWSKFGARGEHGDVFFFSNIGALLFSENFIRYSLHVCLREVKNSLLSFRHSYLRHFS